MRFLTASMTVLVLFATCRDKNLDEMDTNTLQGLTLSVEPYSRPENEQHDMEDLAITVTITNNSEHTWIIEQPVLDYNLVLEVVDEQGETPREQYRNVYPHIDEDYFLTLAEGEVYERVVRMTESDYRFKRGGSYLVKATYSALDIEVYERNYGPLKEGTELFRGQLSSPAVRFELTQ